ncbi:MAG: tRNA (adenosine(37)-N6)-threonylcarbamoyltransferase complex dimerization subunit type 1 TsaB [Cryobacterium sp.]|nr:tRNA (adenosine(37)-N6)-threonylcarbamoyltransferase complex dimerization subunit type 1 TsaB [Cryobacterium sp.]MBX3310215.1 tRNA (adenosine(37)-N6)-threonylcarbamoyltransferase complex dimerization subunit type 1 TsaB [Cryobacterium sp.]
MLLAIDTSAGTGVALVEGDTILAQRAVEDSRRHAEVIGSLMTECLADAGVAVAALSGIAVGMGPGPFTGLRVGIAAANAFALGTQKPVLRVVSHDAIAFGHYASGGSGALLVTTDARRRERYWSAYSGCDGHVLPVRSAGPGIVHPDALERELPEYGSHFRVDAEWVSAGALGLLAERLASHGREFAGRSPLYLRSPDVTLSAGPKRVTS